MKMASTPSTKKGGIKSRAKKHIASKFSKSKVGQNIIQKQFGEDANVLLAVLLKAFERFTDTNTMKQTRKTLFKMATKIKIMMDEGKITEKSYEHIVIPFKQFISLTLEVFKPQDAIGDGSPITDETKRDSEVDGEVLHEIHQSLKGLHTTFGDLISPHMTQKNIDLYYGLLPQIGDPEFLDYLLKDTAYAREKELVHQLLHAIIDFQTLVDLEYSSVMKCVQELWSDCIAEKQIEVGNLTFEKFFQKYPEYEELHSDTREEAALKFMGMISHVVKSLFDFQRVVDEVHCLGRTHFEKHVPLESYEELRECLDLALEEILGNKYTVRRRRSWNSMYNLLVNVFKKDYAIQHADVELSGEH